VSLKRWCGSERSFAWLNLHAIENGAHTDARAVATCRG
jgi:hypothetical protein